jgi:hypothetical protein
MLAIPSFCLVFCLEVRYIGNDRPQNSSDLGIYISKLYMSQIAPFPSTSVRRAGGGWGGQPQRPHRASSWGSNRADELAAFTQIGEKSVPQPCFASYVSRYYRALRCASVFQQRGVTVLNDYA